MFLEESGFPLLLFFIWILSFLTPSHAEPPPARSFESVLQDLVVRLGTDASADRIRLRNPVVVRRIDSSANVPRSYYSVLRNRVVEQLVKNGVEVLRFNSGSRAPQRAVDLELSFSSERLILSVTVIDPLTQTTLLIRKYDSEDPLEPSSSGDRSVRNQYPPNLSHRVFTRYFDAPDFQGRTRGLGFSYRLVETYFNRGRELGFEVGTQLGLRNSRATQQSFKPFNVSVALVHLWALKSEPGEWDHFRPYLSVEFGGRYGAQAFGLFSQLGLEGRVGTSTSIGLYVTRHSRATTYFGDQISSYHGYEFSLGAGLIWDSN